jgi:hypothetical protein
MRSPKDRRAAHEEGLFTPEDNVLGQPIKERRHAPDRRIENLTLEERQLQFCEMPSMKLNNKK